MWPHTRYVGSDCTEIGQKSSTLRLVISHHLQHHHVCGWNESSGSESSTKATQFLHQVGMSIVNIQIVVAALRVSLEVKNAKVERYHVSLWDLESIEITWVRHRKLGKAGELRLGEGRLTHGDAPGTFAVWFVEAWEPFTSDKAWFSNHVSSAVEHRPVVKETVRNGNLKQSPKEANIL